MNSEISTDSARRRAALWIGLRAARANLLPGLMVQGAMVVLLLSYYYWEPARAWLADLARLKERTGYLFSFLAGAVAGGLLPELLTVGVFQRGRVRRENFESLLFGVCLWGTDATVVDAFYRAQAWFFGPQIDFPTVTCKVLVDQFLYNPFFAAPFGLAAYEWKHRGYRLAGLSEVLTARFYREKTFPALLATWGIWIPVVSMVYCLPPLLQMPFFSLALTFWVMLFAWMSRAQRDGVAEPAVL